MSEERNLLILFLDRYSNINSKDNNLKKNIKVEGCYETKFDLEIWRNDWSYIVESIFTVLRSIFDLFPQITVYISIDGVIAKAFSKPLTPGFLFKNINEFFNNSNNTKYKSMKRDSTIPLCSCINKFIKGDNQIKLPDLNSFKTVNCVSIFSLTNERELRKSQESFDQFYRSVTNSIKNICCYNVSRSYSVQHEDWIKNLECSKIYNFKSITSNLLPEAIKNDMLNIYNLTIIYISDIPMKQSSNDEHLSFKVPIILKDSFLSSLHSESTKDQTVKVSLKWLHPKTYQFLNTFHSERFTPFTLPETHQKSTSSLISYLCEGKYAFLSISTHSKSPPSYCLCNHGGIFCIHELHSHLEMVKATKKTKIQLGTEIKDYCTNEMFELARRCRLAPYPDNFNISFKVKSPSILAIECLKRDTMFFSITTRSSPLFKYLENSKILLSIILKCNLTEADYNICKNIITDLLGPDVFEKIEFIPNLPPSIRQKYKNKNLLKSEIISSLYTLVEETYMFSSSHFKLFGLVRKLLYEKQVIQGENLNSNINMREPRLRVDHSTYFYQYISKNTDKKNNLKDLWQNFSVEKSSNPSLLPLYGELTPAFHLYKDIKLATGRDFKNEAFDM